jgi:hypothetical protein
MAALNHSHLESHDCRCGYRTGEIPVLWAAALSAALALVYPQISHSKELAIGQNGQSAAGYSKPIDRAASQPARYLKT